MPERNMSTEAPAVLESPRAIERKRFIGEYRKKPKSIAAIVFASLRYTAQLSFFTIAVIPPAIFFWVSLLADTYQITFLNDILLHLAMGPTEPDAVHAIDGIGIAIWVLLTLLFSVIGWFTFRFQSPVQQAADRHMIQWDSHDTNHHESPIPNAPQDNEAGAAEPHNLEDERENQRPAETMAG